MFNESALSRQEFVLGLKDGDSWRRVNHGYGFNSTPGVDRVEFVRKTKAHVVVLLNKVERKYRVSDGSEVGGKGYFPMPSTPEEIADAEAKIRVNLCKREIDVLVQKLKNVTDERELMQIKDLLKSAVAKAV